MTPSATGKTGARVGAAAGSADGQPRHSTAPHRPVRRADVQEAHSHRRPGVQPAGRRWRDTVHLEVPVFTVAVLVVFFALLTLADVLPGQSSAPGLVAPVR
jgi:hypothetical protein